MARAGMNFIASRFHSAGLIILTPRLLTFSYHYNPPPRVDKIDDDIFKLSVNIIGKMVLSEFVTLFCRKFFFNCTTASIAALGPTQPPV
jgi:hypothetical protein